MTKPIKITKVDHIVHGSHKNVEKIHRKQAFQDKDKRKDKFQNVTVKITWEQGEKLDEFIAYCQNNIICFNCLKKCSAEYFKSNDSDELILSCPHCSSITIDGYEKSKEYVKWFDKILQDYGMSFKDGFPKLIHATSKKDASNVNHRNWIT